MNKKQNKELISALKFALDFLESPCMTEHGWFKGVSWETIRDAAKLRAKEVRRVLKSVK